MNSMTLEKKLENTREELNQVQKVLGTLIAWLDKDIGRHNIENLLDMLHEAPPSKAL